MKIRKLSQPDLPEVLRIQRECYSQDFLESADSFSAKLSAYPDFCFMAVQGEIVVGYVVALPWVFGEILDLDGVEYSIPPDPDSVCIHDMAVSPNARKAGAAKQLMDAVLDTAKQRAYERLFLVAIQGASSYWKRNGFEVVDVDESLKRDLSMYGEEATYMTRAVEEV